MPELNLKSCKRLFLSKGCSPTPKIIIKKVKRTLSEVKEKSKINSLIKDALKNVVCRT